MKIKPDLPPIVLANSIPCFNCLKKEYMLIMFKKDAVWGSYRCLNCAFSGYILRTTLKDANIYRLDRTLTKAYGKDYQVMLEGIGKKPKKSKIYCPLCYGNMETKRTKKTRKAPWYSQCKECFTKYFYNDDHLIRWEYISNIIKSEV